MFKIMLALHLLTAIFAIGPLVGAVTTASRGLRSGDATATATSARTLTIYSYASVIVVIFGFGLMSAKAPWDKSKTVADFGDTWIWLSLLLWLVAMALVLAVVVPALKKAGVAIGGSQPVNALVGRVAGAGGVVGLLFAAIVFLMVYQPGS
ncbi:DUF2269 family protein [Nocardioides terrisoli]|uniref:DUF2269 family protein n=1 Tax=Nocardioides terrisoli TaxID=3388267 RepID=UPI00287B8468|nr:DUF2269 family protein [Nocardioides marmorisolisilvae]